MDQILGRRGPALVYVSDSVPPRVYVLDSTRSAPYWETQRDMYICRALIDYSKTLFSGLPESMLLGSAPTFDFETDH